MVKNNADTMPGISDWIKLGGNVFEKMSELKSVQHYLGAEKGKFILFWLGMRNLGSKHHNDMKTLDYTQKHGNTMLWITKRDKKQ